MGAKTSHVSEHEEWLLTQAQQKSANETNIFMQKKLNLNRQSESSQINDANLLEEIQRFQLNISEVPTREGSSGKDVFIASF